MPANFLRCARHGGKVLTIRPKGPKSRALMKVCKPAGGGKWTHGEVFMSKKKKKSK